MGVRKHIVTEKFPAGRLPEELRRGIASDQDVRVTVEVEDREGVDGRKPLIAYLGAGAGVYSSPEEALEELGAQRNAWP